MEAAELVLPDSTADLESFSRVNFNEDSNSSDNLIIDEDNSRHGSVQLLGSTPLVVISDLVKGLPMKDFLVKERVTELSDAKFGTRGRVLDPPTLINWDILYPKFAEDRASYEDQFLFITPNLIYSSPTYVEYETCERRCPAPRRRTPMAIGALYEKVLVKKKAATTVTKTPPPAPTALAKAEPIGYSSHSKRAIIPNRKFNDDEFQLVVSPSRSPLKAVREVIQSPQVESTTPTDRSARVSRVGAVKETAKSTPTASPPTRSSRLKADVIDEPVKTATARAQNIDPAKPVRGKSITTAARLTPTERKRRREEAELDEDVAIIKRAAKADDPPRIAAPSPKEEAPSVTSRSRINGRSAGRRSPVVSPPRILSPVADTRSPARVTRSPARSVPTVTTALPAKHSVDASKPRISARRVGAPAEAAVSPAVSKLTRTAESRVRSGSSVSRVPSDGGLTVSTTVSPQAKTESTTQDDTDSPASVTPDPTGPCERCGERKSRRYRHWRGHLVCIKCYKYAKLHPKTAFESIAEKFCTNCSRPIAKVFGEGTCWICYSDNLNRQLGCSECSIKDTACWHKLPDGGSVCNNCWLKKFLGQNGTSATTKKEMPKSEKGVRQGRVKPAKEESNWSRDEELFLLRFVTMQDLWSRLSSDTIWQSMAKLQICGSRTAVDMRHHYETSLHSRVREFDAEMSEWQEERRNAVGRF